MLIVITASKKRNMYLVFLVLPSLVIGQVNYYLYTGHNPLSPQQLQNLDGSKGTKFLIHGYRQTGKDLWCDQMKDEYLKKDDFNFIQVDWGSIAFGSYLLTAKNTQNIGRELGDVIVELHKKHNLPLSNVHIIGHSLGSHRAAYANRRISQLLNENVKRISALDPAGPLFELLPLFQGLRKTDADIVDVIHADGGFFGTRNPVGTVDFYPNGGQRHQPGCTLSMILSSQPNYTVGDIIFCSHRRSYHYFTQSINNRLFKATECQSWAEFMRGNCNGATAIMGDGYENEPHSIGRFYVSTENS